VRVSSKPGAGPPDTFLVVGSFDCGAAFRCPDIREVSNPNSQQALEWSRPIPLAGREENLLYIFDHSKLPEAAGVYVFGRRFGRNFEALYVGKAGAIRGRARGQLKNLPLMLHLKKAKSGKRIVLAGRFIPKPADQPEHECQGVRQRGGSTQFRRAIIRSMHRRSARRSERHTDITAVDLAERLSV
jgi:hypothetical protein